MQLLKTFLLVWLVIPAAVYAQDKVILASGDTLEGKASILYPDKYFEEISFDDGTNRRRMKAYQFIWLLKDDEIYRAVKNTDKYQIMKLYKPGYLSLYYYRVDQSYSFGGLYALRRDGIGTEVPNMGFKKNMSRFLSDCNSISADVKAGLYKRKDMEKIADMYNACIEQKTAELNQKTESRELSDEASELINEINSLITESASLGYDELTPILEDVKEKVEEGDDIPNYLKRAIKDQVDKKNPLNDKITELLKKL
jgi:hypothetical protein